MRQHRTRNLEVPGSRFARPGTTIEFVSRRPIPYRQVSTMPGFFVVHETEYAGELIEAEVAGSSLPLAVFVFGVPVSQKDIAIPGREVGFANRASELRVRWRLRDFQVRDRIQAVHQ